jgi:hypothetical protein
LLQSNARKESQWTKIKQRATQEEQEQTRQKAIEARHAQPSREMPLQPLLAAQPPREKPQPQTVSSLQPFPPLALLLRLLLLLLQALPQRA